MSTFKHNIYAILHLLSILVFTLHVFDCKLFPSNSEAGDGRENFNHFLLNSQYSSYRFVGQPWYYYRYINSSPFQERSCKVSGLFKNVCYNISDHSINYYRHLNDSNRPLLWDGMGKEYTTFPTGFVYESLDNFEISWRSVPSSFNPIDNHDIYYLRNKTFVLTSSNNFQFNFGHHLWQYLLPVYSLQSMFGIDKKDTVIVTQKKIQIQKFDRMFAEDHIIIEGLSKKYKTICFDKLVLGDYPCLDRMRLSSGKASGYYSGLKHITANTISCEKPIKITLLNKATRRRPINFKQTVIYLYKRFPSIQFETIKDIGKMSPQEQLNILKETTLLISPAGGIYVSSVLLPHGSVGLQHGFFNSLLNATYDYDTFYMLEFSHFSSVLYPVQAEDTVANTCSHPIFDPAHFVKYGKYVYCSFHVNLTRLGDMVYEILNNWSLFNCNRRLVI